MSFFFGFVLSLCPLGLIGQLRLSSFLEFSFQLLYLVLIGDILLKQIIDFLRVLEQCLIHGFDSSTELLLSV
jgi:hypothetical protein